MPLVLPPPGGLWRPGGKEGDGPIEGRPEAAALPRATDPAPALEPGYPPARLRQTVPWAVNHTVRTTVGGGPQGRCPGVGRKARQRPRGLFLRGDLLAPRLR